MEYAAGGELFDKIGTSLEHRFFLKKKNEFCSVLEPDVGMPEYLAQNYFKQVVAGMVGRKRTHFIDWIYFLGVSSQSGCGTSRFVLSSIRCHAMIDFY